MTSAPDSNTGEAAPGTPDTGMPDPRRGHLHWSERWLTIGEKIAVIASLVAVIWLSRMQSETDIDLARRETTLALVTLSFSEPVFAAKEHLTTELSRNAARYAPLALGEKRRDLPEDLRESFVVMMEFYNNIAICHETGACDKALANEFFRSDACDFLALYNEIAKAEIEREFGAPISTRLSAYCAADTSS